MTHFVIVIQCFFLFLFILIFLWHMNNFSTLNEQCALLHCISIDATIQKCNKKSNQRVESERSTSLFLSWVGNDDNSTKYAIKSNKLLCCHSIVCMCTSNLLKISGWNMNAFFLLMQPIWNEYNLRVSASSMIHLPAPEIIWKAKNGENMLQLVFLNALKL